MNFFPECFDVSIVNDLQFNISTGTLFFSKIEHKGNRRFVENKDSLILDFGKDVYDLSFLTEKFKTVKIYTKGIMEM